MPTSHLHEILQRAHTELERAESVDDADRELLLEVMADIRTLLERRAGAGADVPADQLEHQSVVEGLERAVWRFEETHPRLTTVIGQLIEGVGSIFR